MIELATKRITITGGKDSLSTQLGRELREARGCHNIFITDIPEYNLKTLDSIKKMHDYQKPDIVLHLAALVRGIGASRKNPGKFF